nr:antiterminator Q family protein [Escherichia coli]
MRKHHIDSSTGRRRVGIRELNLTKEQHEWLNGWLELWGAWVYSGRLEKRMSSVIAKFMESVEPGRVITRPMCNDDDGMLISQVVDSVMYIDKKAFGILLSYYAHGSSKRAIASYYHATAKPRKMCGRGGEGWRKPSLATCRNEIDDILKASLFVLYQPMQNAFKMRKRVEKVKHVAVKSLDMQLPI